MSNERGVSLIEVLIAFLLLTIGSLAAAGIVTRQAHVIVGEAQNNEAFSIFSAGQALLDTMNEPQEANGDSFTASSTPSGLSSTEVAPLQSVMALLPNAQLDWQVTPVQGSVCPCQVNQTLTWGPANAQQSASITSVVGY